MERKQSSDFPLMAMLTHDLLSLTLFLFSHPLHFAYLLFFSPYIISILSLFLPLILSTSLFLLTLVSISPYLENQTNKFKIEFLGNICGIVINAICIEPEFGDQRTIGLLEELDEMVISPITRALVGNEVSSVADLFNSGFSYDQEVLLIKDNCEEKLRNCAILDNSVKIDSFIDQNCELSDADQDKEPNNENWAILKNSVQIDSFIDQNYELRDTDINKGPNNENVQNTMEIKDTYCEFYNASTNFDSDNSNQSEKSPDSNTDLKKLHNDLTSPNNGGIIGEKLTQTMSLNRREHARTLSQGLQREGSLKVEREWKRTLACKLFEERMSFKLNEKKSSNNEEGEEDMDLLWEAIEVNSNESNGDKNGVNGDKNGVKNVEREEESESEEEEREEGDVRQLCCLRAFRVSTRKMNLGVGRPNLVKLSKVLKKMSIFHGVARHKEKMSEKWCN